MKQALLVALACLNAALLVALVFHAGAQPAQAQVIGGGANYLVLTVEAAQYYDALYVLDLATRQLAVWKFDKRTNRLVFVTKRLLPRDFGRDRPKPF